MSDKNITAVLGKKLGMTQLWDDGGKVVPVTVVAVEPNVVTGIRTVEDDGYPAVQLAAGAIDPRKVTKPMRGHFEAAGVTPRRHVAEIRTTASGDYSLGQEITVEAFEPGTKVDVVGTTKGKGTAGVMKLHGFSGVGASHGAHRNHRKPGSIGGASTPSRVFKGMRMAGRMGHNRQTTQNLTVFAVDAEKGLLLVKGAVPGPKGGFVVVKTAVKGPLQMASIDTYPAHATTADNAAEHQAHGSKVVSAGSTTEVIDTAPKAQNVDVVNSAGAKSAAADLPAAIFDVPLNVPLIHQVVVAQEAAARQGTHATKTRGMVRGGGRKPYKQKGTGRARQGSTRAPHFAGGGIVHGPQPRDYSQRTPKKMVAAALRSALSDRARNNRIHVITDFGVASTPSTKSALTTLSKVTPIKTDPKRENVLVVVSNADDNTYLSLRNLPTVQVLDQSQLNARDVLLADDIVFTAQALSDYVARTLPKVVGTTGARSAAKETV